MDRPIQSTKNRYYVGHDGSLLHRPSNHRDRRV